MRLLSLLLVFAPATAFAVNVQGAITTNTTWNTAGSPYVMTGDVQVASGVTLTIQAGVTVQAATTDAANLGVSTTKVELIVDGVLVATGSSGSPVVFTTSGANGAWRGLRLNSGAGAGSSLTYARVEKAERAIESNVDYALANGTIENSSAYGLYVNAGTATVTSSTFQSNAYAVYGYGGTLNMSGSLVKQTTSGYAVYLRAAADVHHNTIADNPAVYGVYVSSTSPIILSNNVVTSNGSYGIYVSSGSPTITYNDVWGHSSGNWSGSVGAGNFSANPLVVGSGTYRLTSNSPCRNAGSNGADIGAFPYVSDPTPGPGLQGTLWSNQTISSSQTVVGDLTVAPNVTLTLGPGVTLTFATSDTMVSGADSARTELIVRGALVANGSAASGVVLTSGGSDGAWRGVRIEGGTGSTLTYTRIEKAVRAIESTVSYALANGTVQNSTGYGLYVNGGTVTVTQTTFAQNVYPLYVYSGTLNMSGSLVKQTSSGYGVYLRGGGDLHHNTIVDNPAVYGVYVSSTSPITLANNIIASNGSYGIYVSSGSPAISYNDVWNHSSGNWSGSVGTGNFSANPLFVGSGNYLLTANSPCRNAGSDALDIGAFPYVSDPTPGGLQGTLWTSQTLSSSQTVVGDLTVPAGVTLTLGPGVTLTFATTDGMASGADAQRVELIVRGALVSNGTAQSPVLLTTTGSDGAWRGVRLEGGTGTALTYTRVEKAQRGIESTVSYALSNSTIQSNTSYGLYINGGTATVTGTTFAQNAYPLYGYSGTLNMSGSLVKQTTSGYAVYLRGSADLHHNTIADNPAVYGVYVSSTSPITLTNNVIASNGSYGIYISSGSPTVTYNDVWNHSSGNWSGSVGTGNFSANPLFVGSQNYRLTSNSPCRNAGSDGLDIGAFPYVSDPTPGALQGTLWTNQTLTTSQTVSGDLTVPAGVTLTLGPGVTLTFATTDSMASGADTQRVELIVRGTLVGNGNATSGVLLTTGGSDGAWRGVRLEGGTGTTLAYARIEKAQRGIESTVSYALSNSTIQSNTSYGLYINGGTATVSGTTFAQNAYPIYENSGSLSLTDSLIRATTSGYALYLRAAANVVRNTIAENPAVYGIYVSSTSQVTIQDNVIASNGSYGIYVSSGSPLISHNNVWGHASGNWSGTVGAGMFSANPLFVGGGNYRLTSNSPSRKSSTTGGDQGAFPYTNDPTNGLQGTLWSDLTLSQSATVLGDLTVAPGVTLTINPGVTLTFAASDSMGSGQETTKGELIVRGTLAASGASGSEVVLTTAGSPGGWRGVQVVGGTGTVLSYTRIERAMRGVDSSVGYTLRNSTVDGSTAYGLYANGGTVTVSSSKFTANVYPLYLNSGTLNVDRTLVAGTTSGYAAYLRGAATFDHNTIANNSNGVYVSTTSPVTVRDCIIASNGAYGIYVSSGTVGLTYSDVWGHTSSNLQGVTGGAGMLTPSDPLFLGGGDYRLQATSPCRGTGSSGSDMGAFPYSVGAVDRVEITPSTQSITAGGTFTFTAQAYDAASTPIQGLVYTWSALPAAGTITQNGVLTAACTQGTVTNGVTASTAGKSANATVTIVAGGVAQITVTPASATVPAGGTQAFSATAKDACNNTLPGTVTWSTPTGKGSIDPATGAYTAPCTAGSYTGAVVASSGAVTGSANVTVTAGALSSLSVSPRNPSVPSGGQQQFSAAGADSCGNPLTPTVTWNVSGAAGSITTGGLFTATTNVGSYPNAIEATSGSVTGRTDVNVVGGAVATVTVAPLTATLSAGQKQTFTATARDSAGNVVTATPAWSVTGGGAIDASGEFTAGTSAGTFTVRATVSGIVGTAQVTVQAGAASRVAVTPPTATLAPGGVTTFSAQVFDANNNPTQDPVTWAVTNATAGSISATGAFTAGSTPGTYANVVTATAGTVSGSASVTVQPGALAQLVIAPPAATVRAGGTVAFTATGKDGNGNNVALTPQWTVLRGGGVIDTSGVFTAGATPGTFSDTVQVQAQGLAATASVTVTVGPMVQIAVSPAHPALKMGQQQQFTAKATDAFGNEVTGTVFAWTSDAEAGSVDQTGLFTTGDRPGDHPSAVTAGANGIYGHASVLVLGTVVTPDGGVLDAGSQPDGGANAPDGGAGGGTGRTEARSGCGCSGVGPTALVPLALLALALARVRRRR